MVQYIISVGACHRLLLVIKGGLKLEEFSDRRSTDTSLRAAKGL